MMGPDTGFSADVEYLTWEERLRLRSFKEQGLVNAPVRKHPPVSRYLWSPRY